MINRNTNVERLRFLAAIGIIWFHLGAVPYGSVGYAGLPIFLMVYSALIIQRSVDEPFREFLSKRSGRLLVPWIFWSVVYAVFVVVKYVIKSRETGDFPIHFYLIGSYTHLWYLPYAFMMGILLYGIHYGIWVKVDRRLSVGCLIVISYIGWIVGTHLLPNLHYDPPFPQWIFGVPGIMLGCAIGYSLRLSIRTRIAVLIVIMVSSLVVSIVQLNQGTIQMVIPYGIGISSVCLAFLIPGKSDPISHFLASLTYGIYLVHPMIGSILQFVLRESISVYGLGALTVIGSMFMVALIQRTLLRRFV
jgi:peptidoglycan/LPS O-acetylase OafA/YrhL